MVKFSQELSGIILPHDKCGSPLTSKRETIDPELEKKNFMHAEQMLNEIWLDMIIDSHPVSIKRWRKKYNHIRKWQHFLEIVKCLDKNCCRPFRSNYLKIITESFFSPSITITCSTMNELKWVRQDVDAHYLSSS